MSDSWRPAKGRRRVKGNELDTHWNKNRLPTNRRIKGRRLIVLDIFGLIACRIPAQRKDRLKNREIKDQQVDRLLNMYRTYHRNSQKRYLSLFSRRGLLSLQSTVAGDTALSEFIRPGDDEFEQAKSQTGSYMYRLRPHVLAFLRWCASHPGTDLAILSSTTEANAAPVVERLMEGSGISFVSVGYRDATSPDPEYKRFAKSEVRLLEPYDTVKLLSDIINRLSQKDYSIENTLLLDDSPIKVRFNPADSVVLVPEITSSHFRQKCSSTERVEAHCLPFVAEEIQARLYSNGAAPEDESSDTKEE